MKTISSAIRWFAILSTLLVGCSQASTPANTPQATLPAMATPTAAPPSPAAPTSTPPAPIPLDRIIFSSNRTGDSDIYSVAPDGSCLSRLTTDVKTDDFTPVWSPDGSQIAFVRQPVIFTGFGETYQQSYVYVLALSGDEPAQLAEDSNSEDGAQYQIQPGWSPDGTQVVYVSNNGDNYPDIFKAGVNSHRAIVLDNNADFQLFGYPYNTYTVSWSPDGKAIVYFGSADNGLELFTVPSAGGEIEQLTNGAHHHLNPSWSPDSSKILYLQMESDSDLESGDLHVMDSDGSNDRIISSDQYSDSSPLWSPDGKKIGFVSERDGNKEIYVVDADGQNLTRLTDNLAVDDSPSWAPDSESLAFVSDRDGNEEIYTVQLSSLELTRVTTNPADDTSPAWSPVGAEFSNELCLAQTAPTAEPTAIPEATPALSPQAITAANVDRLVELDRIDPEYIEGSAWSPDSTLVAVETSDYLYLFEYPSLNQLWKIEAGPSTHEDLRISPDGQFIAGESLEGAIDIWQTTDGKLVHSITGYECYRSAVFVSKDILASACDHQLEFWKVANWSLMGAIEDPDNKFSDMVFSPDGAIVAYHDQYDIIKIIEVSSEKTLFELTTDEMIMSLAFSPDGKTLASGTLGNGIMLWDARKGTQIKSLLTDKYCDGLAFSPDGKYIACASSDTDLGTSQIDLTSVESGQLLASLGSPGDVSMSIGGISPDGSLIMSQSVGDCCIRFWSTTDGSLVNTIEFSSHPVTLAFSASPDIVVTGWSDLHIRFLNIIPRDGSFSDQPAEVLDSSTKGFDYLALSPDGRFLVSAPEYGETPIQIWDLSVGKVIKEIEVEGYGLNGLAFSPNGNFFAMIDEGGQLWRVSDWTLYRSLRDTAPWDASLVYSPDGEMIATLVSESNQIKLLHSIDGSLIRLIEANEPGFLAFSPDSKVLASAGAGGLSFWQVADGKLVLEIDTPSASAETDDYSTVGSVWLTGGSALSFSPSGDLVVVGDNLWSFPDGKLIKTLDVTAGALAFSPDGRYLVTLNLDGSISVWGIK